MRLRGLLAVVIALSLVMCLGAGGACSVRCSLGVGCQGGVAMGDMAGMGAGGSAAAMSGCGDRCLAGQVGALDTEGVRAAVAAEVLLLPVTGWTTGLSDSGLRARRLRMLLDTGSPPRLLTTLRI